MINPPFFSLFFFSPLLCTWSWHMFLSLCGGMRYGCYPSHIKIIAFPFETLYPPVSTLTRRELSFSPDLQLPLLHLASVSTSSTNPHHLPLRATTTAAASESGFPLCNTLFLFCSLYLPPPAHSISDHTLHLSLSFPLCVRLRTDGCACVCECARAYTHPCVWEKMSVTGFEREHVCPGTYRTPPLPSNSASLAPPPPPPPHRPPSSSRPAKCHKDAYQCPHTAARPCISFGGLFTYSSTKSELPLPRHLLPNLKQTSVLPRHNEMC